MTLTVIALASDDYTLQSPYYARTRLPVFNDGSGDEVIASAYKETLVRAFEHVKPYVIGLDLTGVA